MISTAIAIPAIADVPSECDWVVIVITVGEGFAVLVALLVGSALVPVPVPVLLAVLLGRWIVTM